MRKPLVFVLAGLGMCLAALASAGERAAKKETPAVLNFEMKSLAGKQVDMAKYRGKVLLVVNVASECGYTPQYKGMQSLHERYGKNGVVVLGFPCNQFGQQEPGTSEEIAAFCSQNYGVTFDMFAKVEVAGPDACGLYQHLTAKETNPKFGGPITWNFEKFLIARDGSVAGRFEADLEPDSEKIVQAIETELAKK